MESPTSKIRNAFAKRISKEYWPRKQILREEMSDLLFFHKSASIKDISEYFNIYISDERRGGRYLTSKKIYAISIEDNKVVKVFKNKNEACRELFIIDGSGNPNIDSAINREYAFNLEGKYIVLSYDKYRKIVNPIIVHSMNMCRFRSFLICLGYPISRNTSRNEIRQLFGFPPDTTLKDMMTYFHLPWGKCGQRGGRSDEVNVCIVSPSSVSKTMSMTSAAKELGVNIFYIRDYIQREVFFEYKTENRRDSFLMYAE